MKKFIGLALIGAISPTAAMAQQEAVQAQPVVAQVQQPTSEHFLPANTEIMLSMNEEITTRRNDEGDTFDLTVLHNVMLGDYVVIPAGTGAVGEITWMTGRGMFGKSGKMDVELRYINLNGRRIPIEGTYRQEGEGNTVATVAGVVLIPVAGLFITGHSGVIPEGRELSARLSEALPVVLPAGAVVSQQSGVVAQAVSAVPAASPQASPELIAQPVFPGAVVPDDAVGVAGESGG